MRSFFEFGAHLILSCAFAGIVGALWLLVPSTAMAFEGKQQDLTVRAESVYGVSLSVDYEVKWKLNTFLGEPTRNLLLRWRLPAQAVLQLNGVEKFGNLPDEIRISDLPPEIRDTIRLYDVNVQVGFFDAPVTTQVFANGYVTFDAGAPAKAGEEWSFNVTGSPDWAEFMTRHNEQPMREEEAKAVMSAGALYGDVQEQNVTAKIALGDVLRWLSQEADKNPVLAMIDAVDLQVVVMDEVLGQPVEEMMTELDLLSDQVEASSNISEIQQIRQSMQELLDMMAVGFPPSYVPAGKSEVYAARRAGIAASLKQLLISLVPDEKALDAEERAYQEWLKAKEAALATMEAEMAAIASAQVEPELEFPFGRVQVSDQNCMKASNIRESGPAVDNYQGDVSRVNFEGIRLYGFKPGGRTESEAWDAEEGDVWAIEPRYTYAGDFNDDGIAVVGILINRTCRFSRDEEQDVMVSKFFDVAIDRDGKHQFCVQRWRDGYYRMDEYGRLHPGSDGPYSYNVGSPCDK